MKAKLSIFSAVFILLMIGSFSLRVAEQEGGGKAGAKAADKYQ